MEPISISVERTGFPVKLGELDLWFDCSLENLRRFFDVENVANDKLKEAQEKAKHIHFPTDVDVEKVDITQVDTALDVNKEFIAAQYDVLFGDGTFKDIYTKYPDIVALEKALDPLGVAIAKRITEFEKERTKKITTKKQEYTKKKAAKQK
ncbi:phage protein [Bacillus sp. JCM 19046]|nr:phage protein [Bacillus sp. JCM 19045]GAF18901.1 phage protein [Bacillus sp. JCM 19046]